MNSGNGYVYNMNYAVFCNVCDAEKASLCICEKRKKSVISNDIEDKLAIREILFNWRDKNKDNLELFRSLTARIAINTKELQKLRDEYKKKITPT